ncbi:MAG: hypothetical protein LBJ17_05500 [Dysgonamonadaceae bacterium]|jgi:hypothetical protein|nr:hypothetical protein [Dysgonamonadaceae bacterium]
MLKQIIADFIEYRAYVKAWLFFKRKAMQMRMAISLADVKQRAMNRQFHIISVMLPDGQDRLVSVSKRDIAALKRKHWLPKNMTVFDLTHSDATFYSTPLSRNNKTAKKDRKKALQSYKRFVESRYKS